MRVFIYKRTHTGDPDENGCFGIEDCMGEKRSWQYEAVIGIGGRGPEAKSYGIDRKVNWIGIGPHRKPRAGSRPLVTFDRFVLYDDRGELVEKAAPKLSKIMYDGQYPPRFVFIESDDDAEVRRILRKAKRAPASKARPVLQRRLCARKKPQHLDEC